jgi:hypothetical protein
MTKYVAVGIDGDDRGHRMALRATPIREAEVGAQRRVARTR